MGRTRSRSRDRDRRSRSRDRRRSRSRDRSREKNRGRKDRSRDRPSRERHRDDERSEPHGAKTGREEARGTPLSSAPKRSASSERRARLEAWKAQKLGGAAASSSAAPAAPAPTVWMPWEDSSLQAQPSSSLSQPLIAASIPPSGTDRPSTAPLMTAAPTLGSSDTGGPPPAVASLAKSGLGLTFAAAAKKAAAAAATLDPEMSLDDDLDPLDAFMAAKVAPEVAAKQAEEALKREEERKKYAEMIAAGKLPKLEDLMSDSEEEPEPDLVIEIPTSRVKLLVGPNGTTIGSIQKKSKARVQIKKAEEDLNRAWGTGSSQPVKMPPGLRQAMQKQAAAAARAAKEGRLLEAATKKAQTAVILLESGAPKEEPVAATAKAEGQVAIKEEAEEDSGDDKPGAPPRKMTTVEVFGDRKAVEIAERMILEAIENREQKKQQREREYERKRDEKRRARVLYHMRHTKDYEALELAPGSTKSEVKKAYRRLAMLWHPDKHPDNQEEAKAKFQVIQKAYDSLMSTDEEEVQMQLSAG